MVNNSVSISRDEFSEDGTVMTYTCLHGFAVNGSSLTGNITCVYDGIIAFWTEAPVCESGILPYILYGRSNV